MTEWITIKHEKSVDPATGEEKGKGHGGTAVVPKESLPLYEKRGWKKAGDAVEPGVSPALKGQQPGSSAQRP